MRVTGAPHVLTLAPIDAPVGSGRDEPVPMKLSNWARNQTWSPAEVLHPRSTDEVADIVRAAHAAGRRVKAIGGGHSFTAVGGDRRRAARARSTRPGHGPRPRPWTDHRRRRHRAPPPQRRARRGRSGDAQPRRHRPPVDRRGDRDRHARHRHCSTATSPPPSSVWNSSPVDGDVVRTTVDKQPDCCTPPGSDSARWASSPRSRCSACRRSTCTPVRRSKCSTTCSTTSPQRCAAVDHFELYWMPGDPAVPGEAQRPHGASRRRRRAGWPTSATSGSVRTSPSAPCAESADGSRRWRRRWPSSSRRRRRSAS